MLWSDGGASACFFNSEVGCVQENDSKKYSGEFIERIFYELFYELKKEKILKFYNKREKIIKSINNLQNIKSYERTILYHLRKINDDLLELLKLKVASGF